MPVKPTRTEILKILPELLRTDEDFRAKVLAILLEFFPSRAEFNEILTRLEENTRAIREASARLDEHSKVIQYLVGKIEEHSRAIQRLTDKVEEHSRVLEEHSRVLEEHSKAIQRLTEKVEEHSRVLEEHSKAIQRLTEKVEEHSRVLEEHSKVIQYLTEKVEEHSKVIQQLIGAVERLQITISRIGNRWGIMAEDMFRRAYSEILTLIFGEEYKVEKKKVEYENKISEIDIVISNGRRAIVEVSATLNMRKAQEISKKVKACREEFKEETPAYVVSATASSDAVIFLANENIRVLTPEFAEE